MVASGESFFTRSGGCEVEVNLGTAVPLLSLCPLVVEAMADDVLLLEGFWRLGRGEFGDEGERWCLVWSVEDRGGVDTLVMLVGGMGVSKGFWVSG